MVDVAVADVVVFAAVTEFDTGVEVAVAVTEVAAAVTEFVTDVEVATVDAEFLFLLLLL